jgi:valyl-tRNA synthetase
MNGENEPAKKAALSVLMELLSGILRMLHPIMPFITEELWQNLGGYFAQDSKNKSILTAPWPESDESKVDVSAIKDMGILQEFVTAIRTVRSEMGVPPGKMITALVKAPSDEQKKFLIDNSQYIKTLAKIEKLEIGENFDKPKQSASAVAAGYDIIIPLAGIIDMDKELKRLQKDLAAAEADLERCGKKFENEDFVKRAPETEIQKMKERMAAAKQKVEHLKDSIKTLQ